MVFNLTWGEAAKVAYEYPGVRKLDEVQMLSLEEIKATSNDHRMSVETAASTGRFASKNLARGSSC